MYDDTTDTSKNGLDLPPISIKQLDGIRDLFRRGIAEAILTQGPGNRQFADALANLVTSDWVSSLVAIWGRELKEFGVGAGKFSSDAGKNRVVEFLSLVDRAINTDLHPSIDVLDTHAEMFLCECYYATDTVVAGVIDALVVAAPDLLVEVLGAGQPAEVRATVAAAVKNWFVTPTEIEQGDVDADTPPSRGDDLKPLPDGKARADELRRRFGITNEKTASRPVRRRLPKAKPAPTGSMQPSRRISARSTRALATTMPHTYKRPGGRSTIFSHRLVLLGMIWSISTG